LLETKRAMQIEAELEVTLEKGAQFRSPDPGHYHFIVDLGEMAFSSDPPNGTSHLILGEPGIVRVRFLVPEAAEHIRPGRTFTFFENMREGSGRVLRVFPSTT
jgi:hypothetical protein